MERGYTSCPSPNLGLIVDGLDEERERRQWHVLRQLQSGSLLEDLQWNESAISQRRFDLRTWNLYCKYNHQHTGLIYTRDHA